MKKSKHTVAEKLCPEGLLVTEIDCADGSAPPITKVNGKTDGLRRLARLCTMTEVDVMPARNISPKPPPYPCSEDCRGKSADPAHPDRYTRPAPSTAT